MPRGELRQRERNVRLLWQTEPHGAEHFRDFTTLPEAREAVPAEAWDWVIFELDRPDYPGVGRVLTTNRRRV